MEIIHLDKTWVPHTACKTCIEALKYWRKGKKKSMPFGIPMIWREPTDQSDM